MFLSMMEIVKKIMPKLTVTTTAYLDEENLGRGLLALEEKQFSWTSANTTPLIVKYSEIRRYGNSTCCNKESSYCLYAVCDSIVGGKRAQKSIRFYVEAECDIASVLEIMLEFVDLDPQRISLESLEQSNELTVSQSTPLIDEVLLKTHVTCIQFWNNFILAGVGGNLHIYVKGANDSWAHSVTRHVFQGQSIHGIRMSCTNNLVVYGGRMVCFLRLYKAEPRRIRLIYSHQAPDWILDCSWLEDNSRIAFLTANNSLVMYNVSIWNPVLISVSHCVERCILYSGTIVGKSWEGASVLAGTVFSTIVIWSNSRAHQNQEILQRLEGHKGVIFSITYCDKIHRISSTSDDRTVRVWNVNFKECNDWKTCEISLMFSLYGHSARVWKSSMFEGGKIVSVGEDGRICLWNNDGKLQNQLSGHQDGEIWSLDASEELQLLATGGSDGGIILWPVRKEKVPYELIFNESKNIKPKCVGFVCGGRPYMVDWSGDVFLHQDSSWRLSFSLPELKSYCLHAVSPNRQLLAFASITGRIIICRCYQGNLHKIMDLKICNGRIYSLLWISNFSILVCESDGIFSTWETTDGLTSLVKKFDYVLPPSKERWVTSCAADGTYLVCGDRCGSLHLYLEQGDMKHPAYSAKKIHGHNGVTDVKYLNKKFVSTGRDGKYREFLVENNMLIMIQCHKLKLDWVAAVCETTTLGIVLFCFHEVFFVIWSLKERRPVVRINCRGGHRSWDCSIDSEHNSIFISYIQGKSVNYCHVPITDVLSQTLVPGLHPKAINSARLVPNLQDNTLHGRLVILGGEDTTLRLVRVDNQSQMQLGIFQSHLSSVRAVDCYQSTFNNTVYVASGGGRGQLIMWKVYQQEASVELIELYSYSVMRHDTADDVSDAAEMRIMDLQIYQCSSERVTIAAGCSDGTLRIFNFSEDPHSISEDQIFNHEHCLLRVSTAKCLRATVLITTSSGGSLFLQTIKESGLLEEIKTENSFLVSKTGINSCDHAVSEDRLILSCGGDDALVNILLLSENPINGCFSVSNKWVHNAAHSCQISGLQMVDNFVFTTGLDQILAIFSWTILNDRISAVLQSRVTLCIPDIHGILVWPCSDKLSYNIFVHGLGTQLLKSSDHLSNQSAINI